MTDKKYVEEQVVVLDRAQLAMEEAVEILFHIACEASADGLPGIAHTTLYRRKQVMEAAGALRSQVKFLLGEKAV